jgi:MFS family permease
MTADREHSAMSSPAGQATEQAKPTAASGGFAPLHQTVFAVLWAATVLGNTGSFMRDVASSWLVTDLSASPTAVAAIQAAASLPVFLLAIPAGVLSDTLDRRKLLIWVQLLLIAASAALMVLAWSGLLSVGALFGLTLVGGIGAALIAPTWQAIVPDLVPRRDLRSAVALNSLGINISRAIGPALGGALLAAFGATLTYGVNILTYLVVIAALVWWRAPVRPDDDLAEGTVGAFRAGLRYARSSRPLHRVLLRALIFFAFASAIWALLPLVARQLLGGNASFYGILLSAVGAGAIVGALTLPRLRAHLDTDRLMLVAAVGTAVVMALVALGPPQWLAVVLLLLLGVAWIIALTTLNSTAQAILPNWVRGRGLAVYLTVFNGALTGGSLLWGLIAESLGQRGALIAAGVGLLVVSLALYRVKLPLGDADLVPSNHWPEPLTAAPIENDRGPVLILIEYRIRQSDRAAFLDALTRFSESRRRDGAYAWGVTEDAADPERILEWFMVESWAEHLRQHKRISRADADLQREVTGFHIGPEAPRVQHLLSLPRSET